MNYFPFLYCFSPLKESTVINLPESKEVHRVPESHSMDAAKMPLPLLSPVSDSAVPTATDLPASNIEKRRHSSNSNSSCSSSLSDSSVDVKVLSSGAPGSVDSLSRLALYQAAVTAAVTRETVPKGKRSTSASPTTTSSAMCDNKDKSDKADKDSCDANEHEDMDSSSSSCDTDSENKDSGHNEELLNKPEDGHVAAPRNSMPCDVKSSTAMSASAPLPSPVAAATAAVVSSPLRASVHPQGKTPNKEDKSKASASSHRRVEEGEHYTIRHPSPERPNQEATVVKHSPPVRAHKDSDKARDRRPEAHNTSSSSEHRRDRDSSSRHGHSHEAEKRRAEERVSSDKDRRPAHTPSKTSKSEEQQRPEYAGRPDGLPASAVPMPVPGQFPESYYSEYFRMLSAGHHGQM
jgi:hypothetical protein